MPLAENSRAIDECDRLQRRLLTMSSHWNALLDRETKAIARELHDDLGQVLTALRMDISLFKLQHPTDGVLIDRANGMLALTDRCMKIVCGLIDGLRPIDLEQDFASALESLCQIFEKRHKLAYHLTISGETGDFDEALTVVLFRILYEALNNIVRHAGPCIASMTYHYATDTGIEIEIRDNGYGFDPSEFVAHQCIGLCLMRESAFALGGRIEIASKKNTGTSVILRIPPESLE